MKEYNSIHDLYYLYHKSHGTDRLLKRIESAEEAKLFFKSFGADLQQASEWTRKYQKEQTPFPLWTKDLRFWTLFLVFLGSTAVMFLTNSRFASTVMMFSSIAASYPICYTIVGHNVCRQLMHTSRKFQSDNLFRWKSDKKIIADTNYFIAKQNKVLEENQLPIPMKDERIPNLYECIWM